MKLLVFGATGGTGTQVIQQALKAGHTVTAFVRNPKKMTVAATRLHIAAGDVLQPAAIDAVMQGHDAVICCIGVPANKAAHLRSEGTRNILQSMQKNGVTRFICQSSLGFGDSAVILQNTPFIFRKLIVPLLLKTTFAEHAVQEAHIKKSGINWTIVRAGSMTNAAFTGLYKHGFDYTDTSIKVKIARRDVAHFMLEQLNSNYYSQQTTGISY